MNYLQEFEQTLRSRLDSARQAKTEQDWQGWSDGLVQFVREAVLQSYRNGQGRTSGGSGHTSALAAGKLKPVQPAP